MATTRCSISPASINFFVWLLPNSPIARACATSKLACARTRDNFTTWDFAVASRATIWPTPTCSATGASMPTLLACSWRRRAPSIRTNLSRWPWTTRFTLSIPPPSICACPFFLGRSSGGTRARSKSTPCWICAGSSRPMLCDRWAGERRESARPTGAGGGGDLSSRPGLHRLSAALPDHPSPGFLRHPRRSKHALPLSRRAAGRSLHGIAFRSNHSPDRTEEFASLSGSSAAHPLLRCRERLAPRFPHQQLSAPGADHRATLPSALASRIVLSLDQTTSAPPRFLRHLGERRQDSGLGRDRGLCPGRNLEKATSLGPQFVQNSANPERDDFRKNADFIGLFAIQQPTSRSRSLYPTGSVQLMMGQH